ncbi:hypothetical protein [Amycolatopsis sp. DG1A-15b]|uniref:ATP dependent DNA ligase n=1 Tax=Amycolatopsis sp. DG1A-15b TaxID=3052846 RepID=UPI00255C2209|nr:hypothetical protein [Amycolatopsis sp. DG1A-15b]WIX93548.1 hypothetical protein QRY02_31505 [Amycolatopsis sp. DG1A-15b]
MLTELQPLERRTHPFAAAPPRDDVRGAHWVQPDLVGEIVYRQFTRAGRVRRTAWRGLRADKKPADVLAPRSVHAPAAAPAQNPFQPSQRPRHRSASASPFKRAIDVSLCLTWASRSTPTVLPRVR